MSATIIPFPQRNPPELGEAGFRLMPLEPEQSSAGAVWAVRLEWDPGEQPDLPAA